jgi:biopolymer transport protein ExbD
VAGTLGGGGKKGMISGINVTPLVDVVLVLLIIMMVASTYIVAQTLKVQLPRSRSTDGAAEQPLTLTVLKSGAMRIDEQELSEAQVTERLKLAIARDPDQAVVVSADTNTPHGSVVHVLDIAKLAGVTKFAINVQPSQ